MTQNNKHTYRELQEKIKLLESRSDCCQIIEIINSIIIKIDIQGNITFANKKCCDTFEYTNSEILEKDWFNNYIALLNTTSETKDIIYDQSLAPLHYKKLIETKSKIEKHIKWSLTPILDQNSFLIGYVGCGEDFTEQHEVQNILIERSERFKALANSSFESIFLSDKGVCIETNQVASEMFGYTYDEIIGIFGTDVIADESKETVKNYMMSGYQKPYEAIAQRKDGSKFIAEFNGKMLTYKGKKIRVTSVRDLSNKTKTKKRSIWSIIKNSFKK